MVWRSLKLLCKDRRVIKTHKWQPSMLGVPIICTYRDPRDVVASSWRVYTVGKMQKVNVRKRNTSYLQDTDIRVIPVSVVLKRVEMVKKTFRMLSKYKAQGKRVICLKYERFAFDRKYLFNQLDRFLGINTPMRVRVDIWSKISIGNVRKIQEKMPNFKQFDAASKVHGQHIGPLDGKSGQWKDAIPEEMHVLVNNRLRDVLREWGYS